MSGSGQARPRRVLWFHPRPLLPAHSGGELRVTGLIDAVVAGGHQVLVVQPGPLGQEQPAGFRVLELPKRRGLGLALAKIFARSPLRTARIPPAVLARAREQITRFDPDVAIVSDLLSWPVAAPLIPSTTPWIFDAHNVETELYAEFARDASGMFDRVTFAIDRWRIARQEPHVIARADAVVAVSSEDAAALNALGAVRRPPVVVASSVPSPETVTGPAPEPVMLFVGTLNHPPNLNAVMELVDRIVPRVREVLPGARLIVVGRKPSQQLREILAAAEGIELVEDAPTLDKHYQAARCAVMPIRSGGGSRLKVYEALAYGLPVVGTTRALSGAVLSDDVVIRAETEDELVDAVVRVLTDEALAADLSSAARDYFIGNLAWEHAAAPLLELIDELT